MPNLSQFPHRCRLRKVAFEWVLTREAIFLPLGCLQGGSALNVSSALTSSSRTRHARLSRCTLHANNIVVGRRNTP